MRRAKLAVAVTLVGLILVARAASGISVLVSGGTVMLIIDVDGNGPDSGDCEYTGAFTDPNIVLTKTQGAGPPFLRICIGTSSGTVGVGQDSSSDFIATSLNSTTTPASGGPSSLGFGIDPPVAIDAYEEFANSAPDGLPININTIELENPPGEEFAVISLCNSGALVRFGGSSVLLPLSFSPNADNPTHLVIPNLPLELAAPDLGTYILRDVYIPMVDGSITMALAGDANDPIVDVDFDNLPACAAGLAPAPTVTAFGAVLVMLGLLAIGTWRLSRRPQFGASLPLP